MNEANESIEEAIIYAKKYLEDVISFFGLNIDIQASHEDDVIQLSVPSTRLNGFLIGQRGENMRSMQLLVSSALKSQNYSYVRVNIDIADYKKQRAERLKEKAQTWLDKVKESGQSLELEPMNPADRRVIHQLAADNGLVSRSEGEGRDRHIVLDVDQQA